MDAVAATIGALITVVIAGGPALAGPMTSVDFATGCVNGGPPPNVPGVQFVGSRCHDSRVPGNVPFFEFSDHWGIVDNTRIGAWRLQFERPVDFVEIGAFAQAAFGLGGAKPFSWEIVGFDVHGTEVARASQDFGLDLAVPRPSAEAGDYPLAALFLRLDAPGVLASVDYILERKTGIDTIAFGPASVPVPAPPSWVLTGMGAAFCLAGLGRQPRASIRRTSRPTGPARRR